MAHQGGRKKNSQMSTNEVFAGRRGIMKIEAREDKNSSAHPAACPQNVSGVTYAGKQAAIKERSQNRQSAAPLPKNSCFTLKISLFLPGSVQQVDTN